MDTEGAILAFAALAQATRLGIFQALIREAPAGLPAGEIARRLIVPHNTLSAHLAVLSKARLIRSDRRGRSIIYRADLEGIRALNVYLLNDCCGGRPDVCGPLIAALTSCRPDEAKEPTDA